jgi:hypothetical protein
MPQYMQKCQGARDRIVWGIGIKSKSYQLVVYFLQFAKKDGQGKVTAVIAQVP